MKHVLKGIVLVLVMLLGACDSKQEYEAGQWDGMTFVSSYFGFSITYDDTLYHQYSTQEMAQVLGVTALELTEDEDLASMYEYMVAAEQDTPLFQFYVENYTFTPGITYDDFIAELVRQLSEQSEVSYLIGAVQDVDWNGVEAKYIPMHADAGYFVLHQDLYLFRKDSYVATLMITYTDGYEQQVQDVLNTIEKVE